MQRPELTNFKRWAGKAKPGDERVYFTTTGFGEDERPAKLFAYARQLFDEQRVILYQRPIMVGKTRQWQYIAKACSTPAVAWLNELSKGVHAPYNRYAHGYDEKPVVLVYGQRGSAGGRGRATRGGAMAGLS